MLDQEHINELFNNNSKAFGDAVEQHYKNGTYSRGSIFFSKIRKYVTRREASILDYGCGTGRISIMLGQAGYSVVGIDPAHDHIEIANSINTQKNVSFQVLKDDLHFEKESYDAVVSSSVFEFVPDVDLYVKNIYNVLKPGGFIFISIPNVYSLWRLYSKIRFGKRYKHFQFQKNLYSVKKIEALLHNFGFQAVGNPTYFESVFDQKGLAVLNRSVLFGTLVLVQFKKKES